MAIKGKSTVRPRFQRLGGVRQLRVERAEDLKALLELDEAHWLATSAPVEGLRVDPRFLELVDANQDGRIRSDELAEAVRWSLESLSDLEGLMTGRETLSLGALRKVGRSGPDLLEIAQEVLTILEREDRTEIGLPELKEYRRLLARDGLNGDGVVLPRAAASAPIRRLLEDCRSHTGGTTDTNGEVGLRWEQVEGFLAEGRRWLDWKAERRDAQGGDSHHLAPFGEDTPEAYDAFQAVREKMDEYFDLSHLAARAPAVLPALTRLMEPCADVRSLEDLQELLPLAEPDPGGELDLEAVAHPDFLEPVERLKDAVLSRLDPPVTGRLPREIWRELSRSLGAYGQWLHRRPESQVGQLGSQRLEEYQDPAALDEVRELFLKDQRVRAILDRVDRLERIILFQRHLLQLLNNFISFPDLYSPVRRALFETGTLVMDGRRFQLAVRVPHRSEHMSMARHSGICLLYCELTGAGQGPWEVAVAVTRGGLGNLAVGKRGIFLETSGQEWDARVVALLENPISLWEALKRPYIRFGRYLTGKIEELSGTGEARFEEHLDQGFSQASRSVSTAQLEESEIPTAPPTVGPLPAEPTAQPGGGGFTRDLVMGASVGLAALASAFAFVTKTLSEMPRTKLIAALIFALTAITVPTMVLSLIKLWRRDLSGILEASGWAINLRMRLTGRLARQFTRQPGLPR